MKIHKVFWINLIIGLCNVRGSVIKNDKLDDNSDSTIKKSYEKLYWFTDTDNDGGRGDYISEIHSSSHQVTKDLPFNLPFFGFNFQNITISLNGFLGFSDPPEKLTYPLVFPVKDWPHKSDPSFIGIFYSKCRIGKITNTDLDQRYPGVYYRLESDLNIRKDEFSNELSDRVMSDIRNGIIGAETFIPKHVIIVTWKNISFAGGIDNSLYKTNTFQAVLTTDEIHTYVIYNYDHIKWTTHTEAGGDTQTGLGGIPAFIGFNAGMGMQSYEFKPYSQTSNILNITNHGWSNDFPGRYIFRIDEKITSGNCKKDLEGIDMPLEISPSSGNMLGGSIINITGPCFNPQYNNITCYFDNEKVTGFIIDINRAFCVQPLLKKQGYITVKVLIGDSDIIWKGKYFVEAPEFATKTISFETNDVHLINPSKIKIKWNPFNITNNINSQIKISLFGYREVNSVGEIEYIDLLVNSTVNSGVYAISPSMYKNRNNSNNIDMEVGFIQISSSDFSVKLWSKPIPLAWYFAPQWQRIYTENWASVLCNNWTVNDVVLGEFNDKLLSCPCTLEQAINDKGRFMPDLNCDKDSNPMCLHNKLAIHCVVTAKNRNIKSQQQCCYSVQGYLLLSQDTMWGSHPSKRHTMDDIPSLSNWFYDKKSLYSCCIWQNEISDGCLVHRNYRRASDDCRNYISPGVSQIHGDPHIITFDFLQYTFNGLGEFVLFKVNTTQDQINVQGRFEQVDDNIYGPVQATRLTSIVSQSNNSTIIEVRLRPKKAQWRYHLDILADGEKIFFDRESLKFQYFNGVTIYTPTYILNQSEVIIMFDSGIGVEVLENSGYLTSRIYVPSKFINKTRGLFGNWSKDMMDDMVLPDGTNYYPNPNNLESIHRDFALKWILSDEEVPWIGSSMFFREYNRTSDFYTNVTFVPNFFKYIRDFLPPNRTADIIAAEDLCGLENYQCLYDYGMSLNKNMSIFSLNSYNNYLNIRAINDKPVISCGVLKTPRFGRKSNFNFTIGTKVLFECDEGYLLKGDNMRFCQDNGQWNEPEIGETECISNLYQN